MGAKETKSEERELYRQYSTEMVVGNLVFVN